LDIEPVGLRVKLTETSLSNREPYSYNQVLHYVDMFVIIVK
jgi:hypothetical protein